MEQNSSDAFGPGSRASHEAAGASSPSASIPIADILEALRPFRRCTQRTMGERPSALLYGLYCGGPDLEVRYEDLYRLASLFRKLKVAQGIEARRAETPSAAPSSDESPTPQSGDAPQVEGEV